MLCRLCWAWLYNMRLKCITSLHCPPWSRLCCYSKEARCRCLWGAPEGRQSLGTLRVQQPYPLWGSSLRPLGPELG